MPGLFDYQKMKNKSLAIQGGEQIRIGDWQVPPEQITQPIELEPLGEVAVSDLAQAALKYYNLTGGTCRPQLAALVFDVTGQHRALEFYFPLLKILEADQQAEFNALLDAIVSPNSGLDLRLLDEQGQEVTEPIAPRSLRYLVAGHLAEVYFYRQDILQTFLDKNNPRRIRLYTSPQAFEKDGGLAGGDFNPETECIQLVLSRLFEGFYGETPGVCPFLHELGHMLDFFNVGWRGMARSSDGLLPGMRLDDGVLFSARARELFAQGQRIELQRYQHYRDGKGQLDSDPTPIGHPYVFQNRTEFIAGYFEMFFRNPNYFEAQNPTLYHAFTELFKQDPRRAWPTDFEFYVRENQKVYREAAQNPARASTLIWKPGI